MNSLERTIRDSKIPRRYKDILYTLASHSGTNNGRNIWPAVDTIARLLGVTRQVVSRGLTWLQTHNLVTLVSDRKGGRRAGKYKGRTAEWEITEDNLEALEHWCGEHASERRRGCRLVIPLDEHGRVDTTQLTARALCKLVEAISELCTHVPGIAVSTEALNLVRRYAEPGTHVQPWRCTQVHTSEPPTNVHTSVSSSSDLERTSEGASHACSTAKQRHDHAGTTSAEVAIQPDQPVRPDDLSVDALTAKARTLLLADDTGGVLDERALKMALVVHAGKVGIALPSDELMGRIRAAAKQAFTERATA